MKVITTLLVCLLLTSCTSVYQTIVTITEIRFSVMNELGAERRAGRINDADWQKIVEADQNYRNAAHTAADALEVYKNTQHGDVTAAIRAVKDTVTILIDALGRYQLANAKVQSVNLSKATKL